MLEHLVGTRLQMFIEFRIFIASSSDCYNIYFTLDIFHIFVLCAFLNIHSLCGDFIA